MSRSSIRRPPILGDQTFFCEAARPGGQVAVAVLICIRTKRSTRATKPYGGQRVKHNEDGHWLLGGTVVLYGTSGCCWLLCLAMLNYG